MASAAELTVQITKLEERVNNHIKFFWVAIAVLGAWLGYITKLVLDVRTTAKQISANIELRHNLDELAALPQNAFKDSLPDLSLSIAKARHENVKVSPRTIEDLQGKLSASADAPNFWPAASSFISYRSFSNALWTAPAKLPRCTDSEPAPSTVSILSPTQATINPGVYENCRFTMDSPEEDARVNEIIQERMAVVIFRHCVIVYRGGAINLVFAFDKYNVPWSVEPKNGIPGGAGTVNISVRDAVRFQDCLFDFVLHSEPPKVGQELTKRLLVNPSNEITLPLSVPTNPPS